MPAFHHPKLEQIYPPKDQEARATLQPCARGILHPTILIVPVSPCLGLKFWTEILDWDSGLGFGAGIRGWGLDATGMQRYLTL